MNQFDGTHRVYEPELIRTMGIAFDAAWHVLRKHCEDRERLRRRLAQIIFGFADEGETDALRMCKLALDEIGKSDLPFAKSTPLEFSVWNSLRSLPGRNWHVQRAYDLFSRIDNRRQVSADRSV